MTTKGEVSGLLIIVIVCIVVMAFLYVIELPTDQDVDLVFCESGGCSDDSLTIESREETLSRSTAVNGAVCSESRDAEAYISVDRTYNRFYVFNRDGVDVNERFNEELGAHTGIVYQLYVYDETTNSYTYEPQVIDLPYGDNSYFDLEEGKSYRVDVYFCDIPLSLASCTETDGGLKPKVFGVTTTTFGVYEDQCVSEKILMERYCDEDNTIRTKTLSCSSEYGSNSICEEGVCVNKPIYERTSTLYYALLFIAIVSLLLFLRGRNKRRRRKRLYNNPLVGMK